LRIGRAVLIAHPAEILHGRSAGLAEAVSEAGTVGVARICGLINDRERIGASKRCFTDVYRLEIRVEDHIGIHSEGIICDLEWNASCIAHHRNLMYQLPFPRLPDLAGTGVTQVRGREGREEGI